MPERAIARRHLRSVPGPEAGSVRSALAEIARPLLARCAFSETKGPIDCAVSGGADSLCLLALAVASGREATAYHVDHGIRPGSDAEASCVERAADLLGARFVSLSVTVAPGPNLEARARAARRSVLPVGVATGHTADDQAETVLLNLLRGSGLDGLAGMRLGAEHPILALRRVEAARMTAALGLHPIRDPTNEDVAFARNRVRHELLPLCEQIAGRDVAALVARGSALLALDADLLEALSVSIDPGSVAALGEAPAPLARRALRRWLRAADSDHHPPSAGTIERVLSVARGGARACELPGGRRVRRTKGRLVLELPPAGAPVPEPRG